MLRSLMSLIVFIVLAVAALFAFHILWWLIQWIAMIGGALVIGYVWGYVDGRWHNREHRRPKEERR